MKRSVLLFAMVFFAALVMVAQTNEPKVDIKVNRELDENGNVVRYDSVYTWSWSSSGNIADQKMIDSLLFKRDEMFKGFPGKSFDDIMNGGILSDEFFKQDDFFKDFFEEFYQGDEFIKHKQEMLEKMIQQMDSIQQVKPKLPQGTVIHSL
ncbi:MAG: hypothetical protein A2W91_06515 [Bacteroidetes bacterium GWF2_38_335]|nr:MAG: hypothetical protein A2W91_06515 [Bacteroidetes bacterium GWF2_38_335]OFY77686.1 MAG: hypothetical protein A2281_18030 [Bacteroidetes bacterium RIFOXYA12_FULL_38_20]HBS89085.1 hypothetical protein [Bacteroidales bacterium]